MSRRLLGIAIAFGLGLVVFAIGSSAEAANVDSAVNVVLTQAADGVVAETPAGPVVHQPKYIDYRYTHRARKRWYCCEPTMQTVLLVPDSRKCSCCGLFEVPVCIPACCVGEPTQKCHAGIFGRGKVVYTWCCGFKLVVTIKKCGDIVVTYIG